MMSGWWAVITPLICMSLPRRDRRGGAFHTTSNNYACWGPNAVCRLRCLMFRHVERHARQLQYRRPLTLQETCEGHDRAVGEFERVMVSESDIQIDLPESCDVTRRRMLPVRYRVLVAWRGIECELRSRPKAYSRVEVSS